MLSFEYRSIIPVLIVDGLDDAVRAVEAVLEGGISTIELTLRTPHALAAIEAAALRFPEALIGAGMVMRPADATAARNAGAQFLTSPGFTAELASAGIGSGLPYLPGAITPSEVIAAREMGFSFIKFFPAREAGGVNLLRVYAAAFEGVAFCPGGGIAEADAADYLALPNVPTLNATWIAPLDAIGRSDWHGITARARDARQKYT